MWRCIISIKAIGRPVQVEASDSTGRTERVCVLSTFRNDGQEACSTTGERAGQGYVMLWACERLYSLGCVRALLFDAA
jgi:hypothetical protein